jgi:aminopeptidase YwaD
VPTASSTKLRRPRRTRRILLGKKKTPLEIRDFLSGEFEPVPLADVMAVLRARETAGAIRLVPKNKG